jgi:hypothetical protein
LIELIELRAHNLLQGMGAGGFIERIGKVDDDVRLLLNLQRTTTGGENAFDSHTRAHTLESPTPQRAKSAKNYPKGKKPLLNKVW